MLQHHKKLNQTKFKIKIKERKEKKRMDGSLHLFQTNQTTNQVK